MSRIKIDVQVKKGEEVLRSFPSLTVNLWDTYAENLREYGEEMLQGCFVGTSGKVNVQNKIRAYASVTDKKTGAYVNDDAAVEKFATALRVTFGAGSELKQERDKAINAMTPTERAAIVQAQALLEQLNTQTAKAVAKRREGKEARAS